MSRPQHPFAPRQVKVNIGGAAPRLGERRDAKGSQGDGFAADLQARAGFVADAQVGNILVRHRRPQAHAVRVKDFHQIGAAPHAAAGGYMHPRHAPGKGRPHLRPLVGDAGALQGQAALLQLRAELGFAHAQSLRFRVKLLPHPAPPHFQQAAVGVVFFHPRAGGLALQAARKNLALVALHLGHGHNAALVQRAGALQFVFRQTQQAVHVRQPRCVALPVGFHGAQLHLNVLQVGFQVDRNGADLHLNVLQVRRLQLVLQFALLQVQRLLAQVQQHQAVAAGHGVPLADGDGQRLGFQRRGEGGVVAGFGGPYQEDRRGAGFRRGGHGAHGKNRLAPLRRLRLRLALNDAARHRDEESKEKKRQQQGDKPSGKLSPPTRHAAHAARDGGRRGRGRVGREKRGGGGGRHGRRKKGKLAIIALFALAANFVCAGKLLRIVRARQFGAERGFLNSFFFG